MDGFSKLMEQISKSNDMHQAKQYRKTGSQSTYSKRTKYTSSWTQIFIHNFNNNETHYSNILWFFFFLLFIKYDNATRSFEKCMF